MPEFELRTEIRSQPLACFELSLLVDAHRASMSKADEKAIAGVTSGYLQFGDVVTWRARHFGIPFTMTVRISAYEKPATFLDEQVSGPFEHWRHEHTFIQNSELTVMIDRVYFEAPFGVVGTLVSKLFLTRYMKNLLTTRNAWLKDQLENTAM